MEIPVADSSTRRDLAEFFKSTRHMQLFLGFGHGYPDTNVHIVSLSLSKYISPFAIATLWANVSPENLKDFNVVDYLSVKTLSYVLISENTKKVNPANKAKKKPY